MAIGQPPVCSHRIMFVHKILCMYLQLFLPKSLTTDINDIAASFKLLLP